MRQKEFEVTEASNQLFLCGKASISFCDIKQILERCVPPPPPQKKSWGLLKLNPGPIGHLLTLLQLGHHHGPSFSYLTLLATMSLNH